MFTRAPARAYPHPGGDTGPPAARCERNQETRTRV